jgi:hypothetical protein
MSPLDLSQPKPHRRLTWRRAPQRMLRVQAAPKAVTSETAAPER